MRLAYLLFSPTFGMHQYTADIANRMAAAGHEVHLLTTVRHPADRYSPRVQIQAIVDTRDTGLSLNALQPRALWRVMAALGALRPDVAHITGPHIWNSLVMTYLHRRRVPVLHTIHDCAAHPGTRYGRLLNLWNRAIVRQADRVLVHGECYLDEMCRQGFSNVVYSPLLHLFLGCACAEVVEQCTVPVQYKPFVLFFGRLEKYKGIGDLLVAWASLGDLPGELVLAGSGSLEGIWEGPLPPRVDLRARLIEDDEALDLFRRCAVVVLPYTGASQSALIAAAYCFSKPVIVTRSGALPEYVEEGRTGWIVEPSDPEGLSACLQEALTDPARLARLGTAGHAWYRKQRDEEGEHLLQVYAQLTASPWEERHGRTRDVQSDILGARRA